MNSTHRWSKELMTPRSRGDQTMILAWIMQSNQRTKGSMQCVSESMRPMSRAHCIDASMRRLLNEAMLYESMDHCYDGSRQRRIKIDASLTEWFMNHRAIESESMDEASSRWESMESSTTGSRNQWAHVSDVTVIWTNEPMSHTHCINAWIKQCFKATLIQ